MEYITAEVAKIQTERIISTINTKKMENLFKCIQEGIAAGEYENYFYEEIPGPIVLKLQEMGYVCKDVSDQRDVGWLISW